MDGMKKTQAPPYSGGIRPVLCSWSGGAGSLGGSAGLQGSGSERHGGTDMALPHAPPSWWSPGYPHTGCILTGASGNSNPGLLSLAASSGLPYYSIAVDVQ